MLVSTLFLSLSPFLSHSRFFPSLFPFPLSLPSPPPLLLSLLPLPLPHPHPLTTPQPPTTDKASHICRLKKAYRNEAAQRRKEERRLAAPTAPTSPATTTGLDAAAAATRGRVTKPKTKTRVVTAASGRPKRSLCVSLYRK